MSTFFDQINAALDASKKSDRQIICRPCVKVDFEDGPLHVWGGDGRLITPDGQAWLGWMHGGNAYISMPNMSDIRDGNSVLHEIRLGYIDKETYDKLRNSQKTVAGRLLTVSWVYLEEGVLRSLTMPGDTLRLRMQKATFSEEIKREKGARFVRNYVASVFVKNGNTGRSQTQFGVMSSVSQRARSAQLYSIPDDAYADFTVLYERGYKFDLL